MAVQCTIGEVKAVSGKSFQDLESSLNRLDTEVRAKLGRGFWGAVSMEVAVHDGEVYGSRLCIVEHTRHWEPTRSETPDNRPGGKQSHG